MWCARVVSKSLNGAEGSIVLYVEYFDDVDPSRTLVAASFTIPRRFTRPEVLQFIRDRGSDLKIRYERRILREARQINKKINEEQRIKQIYPLITIPTEIVI